MSFISSLNLCLRMKDKNPNNGQAVVSNINILFSVLRIVVFDRVNSKWTETFFA